MMVLVNNLIPGNCWCCDGNWCL